MDDVIKERLDAFHGALASDQETESIVRQYVLHGSTYAVTDDQYYQLKERIAQEFGLEVNQDIFLVGSARLGFSINPRQRYRPFHDESDIDVAIVSHVLFQKLWHEVHAYVATGADWPSKPSFESYLVRGWIRPDKLPPSGAFSFADDWWNFFRALQSERVCGPYKVRGGLYHDMHFLEQYQLSAVDGCRDAQSESEAS